MRLSVLLLSLLLWKQQLQGTWAWMMPRTLTTTTSSHQARTTLSSPLSLILSTRNDQNARLSLFQVQTYVPTRTATTTSRTKLAASPTSVVSLGFWGNTGLVMLSIALVKAVYALVAATSKKNQAGDKDEADNPPPAGILNRCPWPFIFFHDVKQGLKDSPTWMVVAFVVLRMLVKRSRLPVPMAS